MIIIRNLLVYFFSIISISDALAKNEKEYFGEPFTRHVLQATVSELFQKNKKCSQNPGSLYSIKVDTVLRGDKKLTELLVYIPQLQDSIERGEKQILFLMDLDKSIPTDILDCYPSEISKRKLLIGYADYRSTEGIYKIIENTSGADLVYSKSCAPHNHIGVTDLLFDGHTFSFASRYSDPIENCREVIGFLDDLVKLATTKFDSISLKPSQPVDEVISKP